MTRHKIDTYDWQYLSGETHYSFPLESGIVLFRVSSDEKLRVYLSHTEDHNCFHPVGVGYSVSMNLGISGFNVLIIEAPKEARIAVHLVLKTRVNQDPLDYTPVPVDLAASEQEKIMMRQAIDQRLQAMGIDPHQYEGDLTDEDDLDFFEDIPDTMPTPYEGTDDEQNNQTPEEVSSEDVSDGDSAGGSAVSASQDPQPDGSGEKGNETSTSGSGES